MRVLVTGGAGFIGSHIVDALTEAGHEAVVLDALLPSAHEGRGELSSTTVPDVRCLVGDVRDPGTVADALRGVDAVCHQAAMVGLGKDFSDAPAYVSCNDHGTAVLLSGMEAAGVRSLVLAGSMVVYGEGRYVCDEHAEVRPGPRAVSELRAGRFEPPCPECGAALRPGLVGEDAPTDPRNTYATTKLAQEHLAAAWARAAGGRAVSLRYHNVYGPRMPRDTPYAGVASFFRSALARGEAPTVYEDGAQRRDFVHVHDVAAANVAALAAVSGTETDTGTGTGTDTGAGAGTGVGEPGEGGGAGSAAAFAAYNVGSDEPHTIGEMAAALAEAYGGPDPVVTGEFRLGDVRHITASSRRAARELGWRAQIGFAEGMKEFATAQMRASSGR
ncbi:NAD-dependent epimerase/dehydratase family protein [Streptomyces reniochalinae]|uniref:NAD-dependent epimerase/dehydratase family protein n=1 Tax=Streptomyces reniochalinae TaxID=2250578 RepID=A0A367E726_9ACTN|nr:NAD-dependent epimerase/dehydratase family protein [Streptomyces reniochalinae]RCG13569.1 NAD-dependent epimerase/dehydratase family protein [Streptomyces reniochalinae]